MEQNRQTTRITVDGRLFQINFWTLTHFGANFPYYSVDEIVTRRKKRFLLGDYIEYEARIPVCEWWTTESRIESAKDDIRTYLEDEKKERDELYEVSRFCRTQAVTNNERTV